MSKSAQVNIPVDTMPASRTFSGNCCDIINSFNERWFQGWDETPEEQKIRFLSLQKHILAHPDFKSKVSDNRDVQNSELAFQKILGSVEKQRLWE